MAGAGRVHAPLARCEAKRSQIGSSARMADNLNACNVPSAVPTMRNQSKLAASRGEASVVSACDNSGDSSSSKSKGLPWWSTTVLKVSSESFLSSTFVRTSKMLKRLKSRGVVESVLSGAVPGASIEVFRCFLVEAWGRKKIAISCELSQRISNCQTGHKNALSTCTFEFGGGGKVEMVRASVPSMMRTAISSDTRAVLFDTRSGTRFAASSADPRFGKMGTCATCSTGLWFVVAKGAAKCAVKRINETVARCAEPFPAACEELTASRCGSSGKMKAFASRRLKSRVYTTENCSKLQTFNFPSRAHEVAKRWRTFRSSRR
mmetsp:Transcript_37821/g.108751  ORF Transcript_37821/g.108751 Transcript_37821/m.108751 type:complete len:320 (+) Transcript_37821:1614-2573(+)